MRKRLILQSALLSLLSLVSYAGPKDNLENVDKLFEYVLKNYEEEQYLVYKFSYVKNGQLKEMTTDNYEGGNNLFAITEFKASTKGDSYVMFVEVPGEEGKLDGEYDGMIAEGKLTGEYKSLSREERQRRYEALVRRVVEELGI